MASEATPGLAAKDRDNTFPARTHVIGVIDPLAKPQVMYLKEELMKKGIVKNEDLGFFLVAVNNNVVGFKSSLSAKSLDITLGTDNTKKLNLWSHNTCTIYWTGYTCSIFCTCRGIFL